MEENNKCKCKYVLGISFVYFHLYGCPEGIIFKKYQELKWYKKIFRRNPYMTYLENIKI